MMPKIGQINKYNEFSINNEVIMPKRLPSFINISTIILPLFILITSGCSMTDNSDLIPRPTNQIAPIDFNSAWSPIGNWIAYVHSSKTEENSGIYFVKPGGSDKHLVLSKAQFPDWSPDGTRLVTTSIPDLQLNVFNTIDGLTNKLTSDPLSKLYPSWTVDGTNIVFSVHAGPDSIVGLWQYKIQEDLQIRLLPNRGFDPDWDPSGNRIVFIRGDNQTNQLAIYNKSYETITNLIDAQTLDSFALWYPSFSPDGQDIVFGVGATSDHEAEIWTFSLQDSTVSRVTIGGLEPSWSPDGETIAFTRLFVYQPGIEGNGYIWLLNITTGTEVQLTFP